MEHWISKMEQ
jgi:hypothetical protein